ncbi:hypothetical protein, partial [Nocardia cyriacigeorgica]|uniref:hypothetical protein n=1 Tax=Nocardia cyriacigeorgica TaxID=135487 RepID=UPI0024554759
DTSTSPPIRRRNARANRTRPPSSSVTPSSLGGYLAFARSGAPSGYNARTRPRREITSRNNLLSTFVEVLVSVA